MWQRARVMGLAVLGGCAADVPTTETGDGAGSTEDVASAATPADACPYRAVDVAVGRDVEVSWSFPLVDHGGATLEQATRPDGVLTLLLVPDVWPALLACDPLEDAIPFPESRLPETGGRAIRNGVTQTSVTVPADYLRPDVPLHVELVWSIDGTTWFEYLFLRPVADSAVTAVAL